MPRYRYYVASSLDGFIADRDGRIDWLLDFGFAEFDAGYRRFISQVGAIVMGRSTYEFLLGEGTEAWSYEVPAFVLTHAELPVVPDHAVRVLEGPVPAARSQIERAAGDRDVWIVGGGPVAAQFADAGMLDELLVTVMPVVLGDGAPLLPLGSTRSLELIGTTSFPSGAVELDYRVRPAESSRTAAISG